MNVGELKKRLAKYPDDLPVILQKDPEGNGYERLHGIDTVAFDADERRIEEVYDDTDPESPEGLTRAVILWP